MIGKLLCWIGWHHWGYVRHAGYGLTRSCQIARHMETYGYDYACVRCGERP